MESPDFEEQAFTWANIKEFANKLTDEQLKQPVKWWGEERGGLLENVGILDENYYRGDEYAFPESQAAHELTENETLDDYELAHPKGTIMFSMDGI